MVSKKAWLGKTVIEIEDIFGTSGLTVYCQRTNEFMRALEVITRDYWFIDSADLYKQIGETPW